MPRTKQSSVKGVQNAYYTITDVMAILGCSRTKAQDVIRALNDELVDKGYMRFPLGKVPKKYVHEKFYGLFDDLEPMKK